jgi:ketosteroid isomerase-like protein
MSTNVKIDLVKTFWQLFSEQEWDAASELLHTNFQALWPQSREKMSAKNFIEVNRNYPGNHKVKVVHIFKIEDKVLTTVWIEADTGQKTFANSIFDIQDDKILRVEEYWAEPYAAPENRKQWVELY